jgi:4-amino-4-deoxy-L-arabinose transferase-like glycosyltransferase
MWSWSDWYYFMPQSTLAQVYIQQGYAIAAGYGYVLGNSPKGIAVLDELYRRVSTENIRILPGSAEPLSKEDVRPELNHPPGIPWLVAMLHRIFGTRADIPLQILGIALDTASAGVFWWIMTRFFSTRVGLLAGMLYALFPPFAYAAVSKMPDGMLSLFVVFCLACTLKAAVRKGWRGIGWNAAAGVCIGLASYLRPDYMLVPIVMMLGLWAYTRRFWRSAVGIAVTQALVVVVLLPWAYRNHNLCGRWIFTSAGVGAVLITGLGEFRNPWGFGGLDEDRHVQALAQGISSPFSCESDSYFRGLFLESIRQQPEAYLTQLVRRLPLVLATPYTFGFQNPLKTTKFSEALKAGEDPYQVVLRRPWYVFMAYWEYLLIAGFTIACLISTAVVALRDRSKSGLILLIVSPHLYALGSHILTHFEPRFVIPSMFGLLVGLAYVLSGRRQFSVANRAFISNEELQRCTG